MRQLVVLFMLLLASCTNPSDPRNSLAGGMLTTIDKLEASGQLPKLDRSDSLFGPDVDHDGIRDDIDKYIEVIATEKKYTRQQTMAMRQVAKSKQRIFTLDLKNGAQVAVVSHEEFRALMCLFFRLGAPGTADAAQIANYIEAITFNTKKRFVVYANYDGALSGSVLSMPAEDETSCDE